MGKKFVMIVDDAPIVIERLTFMIGALENVQQVWSTNSYSNAVLLLEEYKSDIAILDINLPDKSGIELLRYIKSNYPKITVIMLTNQSGDHYRHLCKRLGADHFADKSTQFEQVSDIIGAIP